MIEGQEHPSPRDVIVVAFHGELDIATAEAVNAELGELDPESDVVVDLGKTTFVDSVTLSCFITASRRHRRHGSRLVLADARGAVRRVLAITGLDHAMQYAHSVTEARALMSLSEQDLAGAAPESEDT